MNPVNPVKISPKSSAGSLVFLTGLCNRSWTFLVSQMNKSVAILSYEDIFTPFYAESPILKEIEMKKRALSAIICLFWLTACVTTKPVVVTTSPVDPCPLPSGYKLRPAIEKAEQTLTACPEKLDQVFMKLLESLSLSSVAN